MLAIIYKNLIEGKRSLLISFGGTAFFMLALGFFSLALSTVDTPNMDIAVSIMFYLGAAASYLINASAQTTLVSCDRNSRFYGFILSAPNGKVKLIAGKYGGALLIGIVETAVFLLAKLALGIDGSPVIIIVLTFIQLLMFAIEAPFMVRLGAKVGQAVKGCIVGIVIAVCFVDMLYGENFIGNLDLAQAIDFIDKFQSDSGLRQLLLFGFCGGALILYAVSMLISMALVKKSVIRISDDLEGE